MSVGPDLVLTFVDLKDMKWGIRIDDFRNVYPTVILFTFFHLFKLLVSFLQFL
jgi:hypothetical protein